MNRFTNSICHRISPILYKIANRMVKLNYSINLNNIQYSKNELLFSTEDIINNLEIKDESWNQIKYIGDYMWNDLFKWRYLKRTNFVNYLEEDTICDKVKLTSESFTCKSSGKKNDWIFIKFEKVLSAPFLVEFDASISTETTEFQFAFNYQSIGERYRFNLTNNKSLSFDVVHKGFFHNHIYSVPCSLKLNTPYNFKILIEDFVFSYFVNDKMILSVYQKKKILKSGNIVLILWDSGISNIDSIYKNIHIYKAKLK